MKNNNINILELENKLYMLKIPAKYITTRETAFYYDYVLQFDPNITINQIKARKKDIELFFDSNITIGTINNYIAFRVEKSTRGAVLYRDFFEDIKRAPGLPLVIGQTENGKNLLYDLRKAPHLLVAGTTGSGKSVFLHNCIMSLLINGKSELVLIDIKRVEFALYKRVKMLKYPIINDINTACEKLRGLCNIMDRRYEIMEKYNCRDFESFQKIKPDYNYITVVIDEFSDIIIQNRIIEKYIIRLAQLGRACGIHLIIATQRPDASVITGLIKANIPSKICFHVSNKINSRIILDNPGAENLRGCGDGLFYPVDYKKPVRIQSPYLSNENIIKMLGNQK